MLGNRSTGGVQDLVAVVSAAGRPVSGGGRPISCVLGRLSVVRSPQDRGPLPLHSATYALGAEPWLWVVGDRKAKNRFPNPLQSSRTLIPTPASPPRVCPAWPLPFCLSLPSFRAS